MNGSIDFVGYGDLLLVVVNVLGMCMCLIVLGGVGSNMYLVVLVGLIVKLIVDFKGKCIVFNCGWLWEVLFSKLFVENGLKLFDFRIYNFDLQVGVVVVVVGCVDGFFMLFDVYLFVDKNVGKIIWLIKCVFDDWKMWVELWVFDDFVWCYLDIMQFVVMVYVCVVYWIL